MSGAFEVSITGGTRVSKAYVGGVAVVTNTLDTVQGINTAETNYILKDHLGSTDAVLDANGDVVQRLSFDAWGKRRDVAWTAITPANPFDYELAKRVNRGYTGHEELDPVGLVHMNGRVYDPEIGRFLSADPFVQDASNTQSFNAFAYVLNNPLSLTDPSGFFFGSLFHKIGHIFHNIARGFMSMARTIARSTIARAILTIVACATTGPAGCAAASAGLTLAAGGSIRDAFIAGALAFMQVPGGEGAGAFKGIWGVVGDAVAKLPEALQSIGTVVTHAVVSGALSMAQGGSFASGAISGAISAGSGMLAGGGPLGNTGDGTVNPAGYIARVAVSAVAGGTASMLSGGKFANGAITGAFAQMYNGELHNSEQATMFRVLHGMGYDVLWEPQMADADGRTFRADIMYKFNPDSEGASCACIDAEGQQLFRKAFGDFGVVDVKTPDYPGPTPNQRTGYPDFNFGRATSGTTGTEIFGVDKGANLPPGRVIFWRPDALPQINVPQTMFTRPMQDLDWKK